uniref:Major facilitator superfamily (MFS) profile domain-containing protein n=1 Tax=Bionectria ochroleuca TaxID=29856 RepID=A0A0B7KQL9_BIOOC
MAEITPAELPDNRTAATTPQFVWIANCFVISSTVLQPLFGQIADIFGRRYPLALSIIVFALGSGIGGGSHNVGMLIAGCTIQGVGAGGIYVLIDIVYCDLVPPYQSLKNIFTPS